MSDVPILPGQPQVEGMAVFREPWEAQAFAMALRLYERGVFTWDRWAAVLADEIALAQERGDPDTGETYYHHWLAALERLVAETGTASTEEQVRTRVAWQRAAWRTRHGEPVELTAADFD